MFYGFVEWPAFFFFYCHREKPWRIYEQHNKLCTYVCIAACGNNIAYVRFYELETIFWNGFNQHDDDSHQQNRHDKIFMVRGREEIVLADV